jgi:hypothetical protein
LAQNTRIYAQKIIIGKILFFSEQRHLSPNVAEIATFINGGHSIGPRRAQSLFEESKGVKRLQMFLIHETIS